MQTVSLVTDRSLANQTDIDRAYRTRDLRACFMPAIYQIEPTSDCNLACIMCPNRVLRDKPYLEWDLYRKVVDEIGQFARTIKLSYIGEPLLHPKIVDMITYAKSHSEAKVVMFTNGTLLTHPISVDLVYSGLDEIVFSIDGSSLATFEKIRRNANYDEVVRNIEDFLLYKDDRNPRAAINFIKLKSNEAEMEKVKSDWERHGCDVYFSWMSTWSGQLGIESLSSHTKYGGDQGIERLPCAELWYKTIVNAMGDVVLCCNDYLAVESFGSIKNQSMWDIWNGSKIRNARKCHIDGNYSTLALCLRCKEWSTVQDMEAYLPESRSIAHRP